MQLSSPGIQCLAVFFLLPFFTANAWGDQNGWTDLSAKGLESWATPTGEWLVAGSAVLDPQNPKLLATKPGHGILVNGPKGRTRNLLSKEKFGDIEVHLEFLIPQRSNSGVKFEGLYEIQISDSYGVAKPKA